jgi:hypothetical protein
VLQLVANKLLSLCIWEQHTLYMLFSRVLFLGAMCILVGTVVAAVHTQHATEKWLRRPCFLPHYVRTPTLLLVFLCHPVSELCKN